MKMILIIVNFFFSILVADSNPEPPTIPTLQAVVNHENVSLFWDKTAENSVDPYTGYADFEGYRLYRSDDGGKTWGKLWDKIYDYNGNHVGWDPIVQFDYSIVQDTSHCIYQNDFDTDTDTCGDLVLDTTYTRGVDISGYDPEALWTNLGDNTGIQRTYFDITCVDGKEYMYAITAYDMGLRAYEVEFMYLANELWKDKVADGGNENNVWDDAEEFTDANENGIWDDATSVLAAEDFVDEERENGKYDAAECICPNDNTTSTGTAQSEAACVAILCVGNIPATWYNEEAYTDENENGTKDGSEEFVDETRFNGTWDAAEIYTDCNNNNTYDFGLNLHCADTSWSASNPDSLLGPNGTALPSFESPLLYESFTDYNVNGTWDDEEPFIDKNGNGVWDKRTDPVNVMIIKPGYFASNVETLDNYDVQNDFNIPSSTNIGNGPVRSSVVNEDDIVPALIRFEIDACLDRNGYGDQNGSFATGCINEAQVDCAPGCLEKGPPSLYAYEITDTVTYMPKYTEDIYISDINTEDSILFYKGLPGAVFSSDNASITLPKYIIDNFKLDYHNEDDKSWESNWTNWFHGFQFRFDNSFYYIPAGFFAHHTKLIPSDFIDKDNNGYWNWYQVDGASLPEPSNLMNRLDLNLRYKTNLVEFYSRPNYSYRIEFSTSHISNASRSNPPSGCKNILPEDSDGNQIYTPLPIKIINTTLDQEVDIWHVDKGMEQGWLDYGDIIAGTCDGCDITGDEICFFGLCLPRTGHKNCNWEHNESFVMQDTVYTSNDKEGDVALLFDLKLAFDEVEYMNFVGANINVISAPWSEGSNYQLNQLAYHNGMYYKTKKTIEQAQHPPDIWFDENEDNENDNPWQILYPWEDGDYIEIHPYKWFVDGDSWVIDLSVWGRESALSSTDLDSISVVPNPYFIESDYNESPGQHRLHFTRLPNKCTLSIYTVSGEFVHSVNHNDLFRGDEFWDLKNGQGKLVAPGLYIYVVEASGIEPHIGKFAVIR